MHTDSVHEEMDDGESAEALSANWEHLVSRHRDTGDEIRALHARLTPWYGVEPRGTANWIGIIKAFTRQAASVNRSDFESLILRTTELHHRGMGVLDPDRGPLAVPSPFVSCMPENQGDLEASRHQRQVRHVVAYQEHIRRSIEHFSIVWTALVDGCLMCDWEIINDEFPKLEQLADEVQRAFDIWSACEKGYN